MSELDSPLSFHVIVETPLFGVQFVLGGALGASRATLASGGLVSSLAGPLTGSFDGLIEGRGVPFPRRVRRWSASWSGRCHRRLLLLLLLLLMLLLRRTDRRAFLLLCYARLLLLVMVVVMLLLVMMMVVLVMLLLVVVLLLGLMLLARVTVAGDTARSAGLLERHHVDLLLLRFRGCLNAEVLQPLVIRPTNAEVAMIAKRISHVRLLLFLLLLLAVLVLFPPVVEPFHVRQSLTRDLAHRRRPYDRFGQAFR